MTRRPGRDPLERAIELALRPGSFVSYHACFSFVRDLEAVKGQIEALTPKQASRALDLCEMFLAGCHEKASEIDDSGGSFGQFVQDLFCDWIKARQANKTDPQRDGLQTAGVDGRRSVGILPRPRQTRGQGP